MLTLLPAVDVAGGQAVRLVQGAAGTETGYGDPAGAATAFRDDGATWLHLVDLDAAFGRGSNAEVLAEVVAHVSPDMAVELSGGIRDDGSLRAALATGARRVNIGTAALEDADWCDRVIGEYGDRVAIGLDVRARPANDPAGAGWTLAARGWTRDGGDLYRVLERLDKAGGQRYVVTDISRDGTLTGPGVDLLRDVCARTAAAVIASGGVATLDDLRTLAALEPLGVEGVITGKALYAGAFTVAEALAALRSPRVEG
jgi:phosphoribosylanthranilate isomerase